MSEAKKVRIAPTPSGFLHDGNLANFLLNVKLAGQSGEVLLRIDDLDRGRYRKKYVQDIFRLITALGIQPDEGPEDLPDFEESWSQHTRVKSYELTLNQLRDHPLVFACPCSRKELSDGQHLYGCLEGKIDKGEVGVAWRINTRVVSQPIQIKDLVSAEGFTVDLHATAPDFVVRTKTGQPSYQVACLVDDLTFGITHIGRGMDLLGSTAAQILLSELLDEEPITHQVSYLHHPLLTTEDGLKMSKSAGHGGTGIVLTPELIQSLNEIAEVWLGG